jgi:uncharacterized protein YndB with AHSA1/START domain
MSIHCETTINRPVADVYDYFANPDKYVAQNTPDIESVDRLTPGPTAPGSTFRFRHSAGPFRESTSRYTVVDPNREVQFDGVVGPLRPWARLTFEATDGGTAVVFTGKANPVGAMKLLSPLASRRGRRLWTERLAKAKAALEGDKERRS